MKKSKKDNIKNVVTGSKSVEYDEHSITATHEIETHESHALVESLMEQLFDSQFLNNELEELALIPITMLLPQGDKERFFLFSPILNMYKYVVTPVEAIVVEESNGKETLCIIHNVPYLVPDKYLKNVGYN